MALLGFELQKAYGALSLSCLLGSTTDASLATRGLALTFTRLYPGDIANRFKPGIMGRGWRDNFDYQLGQPDSTSVLIQTPCGGLRSFKDVAGIWQSASAIDLAQLTAAEGGGFNLGETNGTVRTFDGSGRLGAISDPNHNQLTLVYTGDL